MDIRNLVPQSDIDHIKSRMDKARELMVENAALDLVSSASEIGSHMDDFKDAVEVNDHDGANSFHLVMLRVAAAMKKNPVLVDVMRDSPQWDDNGKLSDIFLAAHAVAQEAYVKAEPMWEDRVVFAMCGP